MDVLNPGLLGSARDFRERFAVPIEKLLDKDRGDHLRRMIRPFVLRRTKTDPEIAGDLPDKIEMKVYCNLTVEQAAMYERATSEMLGQIDSASGIRRRGLILAVLTRLKQICDHPVLVSDETGEPILDRRSGKCERLLDMLEEVLEEKESALVFTQYAQMGHLLEKILTERLRVPVSYLHGGTPQKQRDEMVANFQQQPQPGVFILSLRAGGLGLNLTAANHVFHFDRWWNPAVENQATDRAHRIGQKRSVQVHKFIAVGTVEERIDRMLSEKTQLAESIVGGGDEWLTDLSTSELREYLKLSDEAVGEF
jgi:SNF2 family DNA or RNA helicase